MKKEGDVISNGTNTHSTMGFMYFFGEKYVSSYEAKEQARQWKDKCDV